MERDQEDAVFKALADRTRRMLLDRLRDHDGQSLSELTEGTDMSRFGVAKHLGILEEAGLVVVRRQGRLRLHHLNPVPIQQIHDRWIDKYTAHRAQTLLELRSELEDLP